MRIIHELKITKISYNEYKIEDPESGKIVYYKTDWLNEEEDMQNIIDLFREDLDLGDLGESPSV